ncbi:replicator initiator RepC [Gluconacetobacter diazotrophicus]|uniref:Replicator initiator RepC n=2 Tax=Gluconacetobacter diazotrophicus TaxID=33996 RepID=A0A7W4I557_GLUDI|nr:replicator initiator RepC [Gluconacetobacter diazotrophicus]
MIEAREELLAPPPAYPGKGDLLRMLKSLRSGSGLSRPALSLLLAMIEKTRPESWEALETPFIYAHNETLMRWTDCSLTTLHRAVRELADARMLVPQDGRNGQRGRRWQGADESQRVGFNLASLRYRWSDLLDRSDMIRRQREEVSFLRGEIADLNDRLRREAEARDNTQVSASAVRIMRKRMRTECLATLRGYFSEMSALFHQVLDTPPASASATSKPPCGAVDNPRSVPSGTPIVAPMPPQSGTHYTDTKDIQLSKKVDLVAACGRDRIEAMRRVSADPTQPTPGALDRSALRGFKATTMFYLQICAPLRDLCASPRPSMDDLITAAEVLSARMGVTHHAWAQGCQVLGRFEAAVTTIVMTARRENGAEIRRPDAYFRSLIERAATRELFLDRSLYALRDVAASAGEAGGARC